MWIFGEIFAKTKIRTKIRNHKIKLSDVKPLGELYNRSQVGRLIFSNRV